MTNIPEERWRPLLDALVDEIAPADPAWREAFLSVPRHVFVPGFHDERNPPAWIGSDDPAWLPGVYADQSLVTQLRRHPDDPENWWPTSSSSRPSLMLSMLEALDVADGMRVLEIGTGTGYNAALLGARLGDRHVVSVDIDPELVETARGRLAFLGHHPVLVAADGREGCPGEAPYDRVIATHSVERVPYTWVSQTRPGGVILVDIRSVGNTHIGHIARLTVDDDGTASGDFGHAEPGCFMPARSDAATPNRRFPPAMDLRDAITRVSDLDGAVLGDPDMAWALWLAAPDIGFVRMGQRTLLFTSDGSWALAEEGRVRTAGTRDLWAAAENAHAEWESAGRPAIGDHTITVTPEGQRITPA
ncbi:protein-L-isoaspartate(D-aspartate) O-methyltransferase [Marinactinospora thermotolerans DSM 45154]|uniref:Protein-L-isoaspartate O-methyltransferase n=2 Tax=Marinactinospora thermotolerans TaxID=531310 RepID=A0A1T4QFA9_9ACTN|nr:methyltransferase domain-containing protein [Marinactinospora thermotolerans]SKA02483.1 protein-L-isoaspartate(D-aspartate) O-methyltransferase [Marinactinospora thermotolerans DSM 45154]